MMKNENHRATILQLLLPLFIILFGVVMRLVPHIPNIAPVTAIALFGGMYLDKKYAVVLPLLIMVISDFFIGFHDTLLFVYVSFIISGLLGLWARKQKTAGKILVVTVLSSVIFFMLTNFGVWLVSDMYPKTKDGMVTAFVLALPFFRNTISGDLLYTTVFILMFEFIQYLVLRRRVVLARRRS